MKTFYLESTDDSPRLFFNAEKGTLELSGRAFMVHAHEYQQMIFEWMRSYIQNPQPVTRIHIDLEYTNAASEQLIASIMGELNKYHIMGHTIQVDWSVDEENETMRQMAEEFQEYFDVPTQIRLMATKSILI